MIKSMYISNCRFVIRQKRIRHPSNDKKGFDKQHSLGVIFDTVNLK